MSERRSGHCVVCAMRVIRRDDGEWHHWTPGEYDHGAKPDRTHW